MIGIIMTVILVIRVAELFIDPFIGNTIDKTNTRWGRFKPWVIVGGFVAALSLAILFTDLGGLTTSNPLLYLIIFAILYLSNGYLLFSKRRCYLVYGSSNVL